MRHDVNINLKEVYVIAIANKS